MVKKKSCSGGRFPFISWVKAVCPDWLRPLARNVLILYSRLQYNIVKALHTGHAKLQPNRARLYCPCCNSHFVTFTDGNYINRPDYFDLERYMSCRQDVLCPVCRSLPRHRILAVWCQQNLSSLKDKSILYFAPENGMDQWMKRKGIEVTTADLYTAADLKLNLDQIEQPSASWDLVFCNHVLEHVPDYKRALRELYRILKPGGRLICSFPIDMRYERVQEDAALVGDDSPRRTGSGFVSLGKRIICVSLAGIL